LSFNARRDPIRDQLRSGTNFDQVPNLDRVIDLSQSFLSDLLFVPSRDSPMQDDFGAVDLEPQIAILKSSGRHQSRTDRFADTVILQTRLGADSFHRACFLLLFQQEL